MLKSPIAAACAAALAFVPASAPATPAAPFPATPASEAPAPTSILHNHAPDADPGFAPGQSRADYHAWLAQSSDHQEQVRAFRAYLAEAGVEGVLPIWQLVRTASSWRQCRADRFEVAPTSDWPNIVETLRFVDRNVIPAVGDVEAVSGYRNARLNACSAGAPASAHRLFFALDLVPVSAAVTRGELIRDVCSAHARDGRAFQTGLGFYNGVRFHVDSNGFRRWGPDGRGATSPCVTYS